MEQASATGKCIAVTWLLASLLGVTLFAEGLEIRGRVVAADDRRSPLRGFVGGFADPDAFGLRGGL